eukprot:TRINITY_DN84380_c0_g1_i1.p1 TRINITY_DN84380_c0_g1~~TRINITY_DN84380_c0_g1_i1.p1  ORF type:complete len:697 (+),score=43.24 TRINITY_DN84380_c0_g1_i1:21-2111(+)
MESAAEFDARSQQIAADEEFARRLQEEESRPPRPPPRRFQARRRPSPSSRSSEEVSEEENDSTDGEESSEESSPGGLRQRYHLGLRNHASPSLVPSRAQPVPLAFPRGAPYVPATPSFGSSSLHPAQPAAFSKGRIESTGTCVTMERCGQFGQETTCSICIVDFEVGDRCRLLPCDHPFHQACIDDWLERSNTCPNCRAVVCKKRDREPESTLGSMFEAVPLTHPLRRYEASTNLQRALHQLVEQQSRPFARPSTRFLTSSDSPHEFRGRLGADRRPKRRRLSVDQERHTPATTSRYAQDIQHLHNHFGGGGNTTSGSSSGHKSAQPTSTLINADLGGQFGGGGVLPSFPTTTVTPQQPLGWQFPSSPNNATATTFGSSWPNSTAVHVSTNAPTTATTATGTILSSPQQPVGGPSSSSSSPFFGGWGIPASVADPQIAVQPTTTVSLSSNVPFTFQAGTGGVSTGGSSSTSGNVVYPPGSTFGIPTTTGAPSGFATAVHPTTTTTTQQQEPLQPIQEPLRPIIPEHSATFPAVPARPTLMQNFTWPVPNSTITTTSSSTSSAQPCHMYPSVPQPTHTTTTTTTTHAHNMQQPHRPHLPPGGVRVGENDDVILLGMSRQPVAVEPLVRRNETNPQRAQQFTVDATATDMSVPQPHHDVALGLPHNPIPIPPDDPFDCPVAADDFMTAWTGPSDDWLM